MTELLNLLLDYFGFAALLGIVLISRRAADQIAQLPTWSHVLVAVALLLPFASGATAVWAISWLGTSFLENTLSEPALGVLWWTIQLVILAALGWRLWSFHWSWFYLASFVVGLGIGYIGIFGS